MSDGKWQQVTVFSFLIVAILMLSGSIFLHVRQKHHFGRLSHSRHTSSSSSGGGTSNAAAAVDIPIDVNSVAVAAFKHTPNSNDTTDPNVSSSSEEGENQSPSDSVEAINRKSTNFITEACLQCICETISGCNRTFCGVDNQPCGLYRISMHYWADAGEPIVEGPDFALTTNDEYSSCINNPYCAARTINSYIFKYQRDCDGDGVVNCPDFIRLHVLGPTGCLARPLDALFETRMHQCFEKFGSDVSNM